MSPTSLLGSKHTSFSNGLVLLLSYTGEEPGLDDDGLLGDTLAKNLEVSCSGAVNDGGLVLGVLVLNPSLLRYQGPQLQKHNNI